MPRDCYFCLIADECVEFFGVGNTPPCASEQGESQTTDTQQLKAEISALCAEFRELYDGDLGGEAVSLLLTELQKLSAV